MVKNFIASQEEALATFLAALPQTLTVQERRSMSGPAKEVVYTKPEQFSEYRCSIPRTYEHAFDKQRREYERTIRLAKVDLSSMERRLSEWKAPAKVS